MKKCLLSLCLFVSACATWDQDRFYNENGKNKYIVVEDEYCSKTKITYDKLFVESLNLRNELLNASKNCILNGPKDETYSLLKQKVANYANLYNSTGFEKLDNENLKKQNTCFSTMNATQFFIPKIVDEIIKSYSQAIAHCSEKANEIFVNARSSRSFEKEMKDFAQGEFEQAFSLKLNKL